MASLFRSRVLLCAFIVAISGSCGTPEAPQKITISNAASFKPSSYREIKNIRDELAAIITVCRDDLGLPVVDPLIVYLYKTTASFKFYTGRGSHVDISAFAEPGKMHIDIEGLGPGPQLFLLAHEYGHNIQHRIGRLSTIPIFFNEGFADWVASSVLHYLKWQNYAVTRDRIVQELIRHKNTIPDIASLHDNSIWINTIAKGTVASTIAYDLAFFIVDRLVEEKGLDAVIAYQRSGDFDGTFGVSFTRIAGTIEKSLLDKSFKRGEFKITASAWTRGDKWTFLQNDSGNVATVDNEIVGEEIFRGRPVFVVKSMDVENLYDKEDLTLLAVRKIGGPLIMEVSKTSGFISWPLQPQREWRIILAGNNLTNNSTFKYDQVMVVAGLEKIRVAAGEFDTVRLEAFGALSGKLRAEYWYSPKVRWFVKKRLYSDEVGATEETLLRVRLQN